MEEQLKKKGYVLFSVIVNQGIGSKVLKEAKELGVSGGTIFLGKGTARSNFLQLLGLYEIKKEVVLMAAHAELENKIHEGLTEKFHLEKPNHGIAFSIYLNKVVGINNCHCDNESERGDKENMGYEAIFTIVERGLAEEIVDAAVSAGAQGATIINARGAGTHENSMLFAMPIEPEKEIVMILINKAKSDTVIKAIKDSFHIDEPGKGIMFTLDVNKTSGLFESNN